MIGGHTFEGVLDCGETLREMTARVWAGRPFLHARYNDGEFRAMFDRTYWEKDVNSDGHRYYPALGDALRESFAWTVRESAQTRGEAALVGSYMFNDYEHDAVPFATDFVRTERLPYLEAKWVTGEFWHPDPSGPAYFDDLYELVLALRGRPTLLVANGKLAGARHCMGAAYVEIPERAAWHATADVLADCLQHCVADRDAAFVWCAGMPGKVWARRIYGEFPTTTHVDAGHVFDGAFGLRNREWQQRAAGPHYELCRDEFWPWVRSFVPGGSP